MVEMIGVWLCVVCLGLLPPFLLYFYVTKEFAKTKPYLTGLVGGLVCYGLPWFLLQGSSLFDRIDNSGFGLLVVLVLTKALLGEVSKHWLGKINNDGAYQWRHYLPLGLGFGHAFVLTIFSKPVGSFVQMLLANKTMAQAGSQMLQQLDLKGAKVLWLVLFILGMVYAEIGTSILNGMYNNKGKKIYWLTANLFSILFATMVFYPWLTGSWYGGAGALMFVVGLTLIERYKDAFSKYVTDNRSFRGFKR